MIASCNTVVLLSFLDTMTKKGFDKNGERLHRHISGWKQAAILISARKAYSQAYFLLRSSSRVVLKQAPTACEKRVFYVICNIYVQRAVVERIRLYPRGPIKQEHETIPLNKGIPPESVPGKESVESSPAAAFMTTQWIRVRRCESKGSSGQESR